MMHKYMWLLMFTLSCLSIALSESGRSKVKNRFSYNHIFINIFKLPNV